VGCEGLELLLSPDFQSFSTEDAAPADLSVTFAVGEPALARGETLFAAGTVWELCADPVGPGAVVVWSPNSSGPVRCRARCSESFDSVEVRLSSWSGPLELASLSSLFEVLFQTRLARSSGGLLLHACGLVLGGRGLLLPGSSGGGKSTLSQFFSGEETLSDERVALAARPDGTHEIHGTPWRGTAGRVQAAKAELGAIAFLGPHEPPWGLRPLSTAEAFQRLTFHGYPPLWDRTGLIATLDLATRATTNLPVFELRYQPDAPGLREILEEALCRP
jgi:hypothetical protein